jgi:hypothetical protein
MEKNEQLLSLAADTANSLIDPLTQQLRQLADASDWPAEVVSQLSVEWDGTSISVAYPPEIAEKVNDLEYGTNSDKPNSVIRSFIYRSVPIVKNVFAHKTVKDLMDIEGVFA